MSIWKIRGRSGTMWVQLPTGKRMELTTGYSGPTTGPQAPAGGRDGRRTPPNLGRTGGVQQTEDESDVDVA